MFLNQLINSNYQILNRKTLNNMYGYKSRYFQALNLLINQVTIFGTINLRQKYQTYSMLRQVNDNTVKKYRSTLLISYYIALWHPDIPVVIIGKNCPTTRIRQQRSIQHFIVTANSNQGLTIQKCHGCSLQRTE